MNGGSPLDDNLPVVRSLMEKADLYRSVSAPSALVAGFLSAAAAGGVYYNNEVKMILGRTVRPREYASLWLIVLLISVVTAVIFLRRKSRGLSLAGAETTRFALLAVTPNLLIPALFTIWFFQTGYLGARELELVAVWVAFYGLALLSTSWFAPRSLVVLGWLFLLSSMSIPVLMNVIDNLTDDVPDTVMGVTFGLYHIAYAILVWPSRNSRSPVPPESAGL